MKNENERFRIVREYCCLNQEKVGKPEQSREEAEEIAGVPSKKKNRNLKPFTADQNREEAVKNGRKGGLASGEVRRRRKELREFLNQYLNQKAVPPAREWMQEHGVDPDDCCNLMAIILAVFCRAMDGDVEAATTILEWAGLLPMQVEQEEVERLRLEKTRSQADIVSALDYDGEEEKSDVVIYKPIKTKDMEFAGTQPSAKGT